MSKRSNKMFCDFNDYFDYLCPGIVNTLKSYYRISLPRRMRGKGGV
jgi:hypothetical protein